MFHDWDLIVWSILLSIAFIGVGISGIVSLFESVIVGVRAESRIIANNKLSQVLGWRSLM